MRYFLFFCSALFALILVQVIDNLSFHLGVTADFSDVEHYDYWFATRAVVFVIWLIGCMLMLNISITLIAAIILSVATAVMWLVFMLMMFGEITFSENEAAEAFISIVYLIGTLGMALCSKHLINMYLEEREKPFFS